MGDMGCYMRIECYCFHLIFKSMFRNIFVYILRLLITWKAENFFPDLLELIMVLEPYKLKEKTPRPNHHRMMEFLNGKPSYPMI